MDPNVTLDALRNALDRLAALLDEPGTAGDDVVELFEALDGWLSRGGFLPEAWAR